MPALFRYTYKTVSLHQPLYFGDAVRIDPATYVPQRTTRPEPLPRPYRGVTTDTFAANVARAERLEAERLAAERIRLAIMLSAMHGGGKRKRLPLPLLPR